MRSVLNEETIFDAIKATADGIKAVADKKKERTGGSFLNGSITRYTKDLVMTFPVLADTTVSSNTLMLINKAHEKHIADLMQMLFASKSISGKDGREALQSIHKNIDGMGMDEIIDALNGEFGDNKFFESAEFKADARIALREMTKNLTDGGAYKTFPMDSFNEKSLNNYRVKGNDDHMLVYEDATTDTLRMELDKKRDEREAEKAKREERKEVREIIAADAQAKKNQIDLMSRRIIPGDIKKANDLQPTLMIVNVNVKGPNGDFKETPIICGIKSRLISVEALDIVERFVSKNKSDLSLKNLIRATTGEIRLGRDFIFNIKQAKINAKNAVKKGPAARIWDTLEKRSLARNANRIAKYSNDGSAIATVVMGQETVNYLKNQFNIDVENPKTAAVFMEAYCLLGLVIADEANEVAKFMYDGNTSFEVLSYMALSRDKADQEYKKLINMINNSGR